jgi:2-octaprenylphenol hydroxylase
MTHHFFQSIDKSIVADIVVVGAGLVGLAAAIAFAKQGKNVVLVDAKKSEKKLKKAWDERLYALTPATEIWLKQLEVWADVDKSRVNDINAMHIWEAETSLMLADSDANFPKLGVIIENQNLQHALWQQIKTLGVTVVSDANCISLDITPHDTQLGLQGGIAITAKLIVAADGVNSWLRQQAGIDIKRKHFHQTAIVANFLAEKNHGNIARQWFAPNDTLALLPLPNQHVSMVWSVSTHKAAQLLLLSADELAQSVCKQAQGALGGLNPVSKTLSFELNQQTATKLIADRMVLVGDAAHQIHPMAGQGVNLGLRDVMKLDELTTKCQDVGDFSLLRQYERARTADITTMNMLTTGLDYLFASDKALVKKVTIWGLHQINKQAAIKKLLIQQVAA